MSFRRILFTLFFICLYICRPSFGKCEDPVIAALQSMRIQPYNDAVNGFTSRCPFRVRRFVLAESEGVDLPTKIRNMGAAVILAIGSEAFNRVKAITDIPIVCLMTPKILTAPAAPNFYGIRMRAAAENQIELISAVLPDIRRIGLIYNPDQSGHFVRKASDTAGDFGIEIFSKAINKAKSMPDALIKLSHCIDAFWMLPDTAVVTPEVIEHLMLFSIKHGIPVITFSRKYIEAGAVMSISVDAFDLGCQAGNIARKLLTSPAAASIPKFSEARKSVVSVNRNIAEKLRVRLDDFILNTSLAASDDLPSILSKDVTF